MSVIKDTATAFTFLPPSPREGDHGVVEGVFKHKLTFRFYRREIQTALPFALRVSTSPCRCHFERSAQHGVEILRKQNREAKSRQGFAQDDRGGDFRKDF